jgi:hypothetical protein
MQPCEPRVLQHADDLVEDGRRDEEGEALVRQASRIWAGIPAVLKTALTRTFASRTARIIPSGVGLLLAPRGRRQPLRAQQPRA